MNRHVNWHKGHGTVGGALILAQRPGENKLLGLMETSLFMRWSSDRVRFWPSLTIVDRASNSLWKFDGAVEARLHAERSRRENPGWLIEAWDAYHKDLPIVINWSEWHESSDKFMVRNPGFSMREQRTSEHH